MKIISIGSDRKLFEMGSEVVHRQLRRAADLDWLKIIVFAKRSLGLQPLTLGDKLTVYPTNSITRWLYSLDAVGVAKRLPSPDLVTAQDPFEAGWAAWRLARWWGVKLELQIHTDLFNPKFAQQSLLNQLRVRLARFLLPRADRVRVVSQKIATSLRQEGIKLQTEPVVEPVWIDLEKLKNSPLRTDLHQKYPQFQPIILMASRLTWEKNIALAIEVMPEVLALRPQAGLIIVGGGPEERQLKRLVAEKNLEKSVLFEPWSSDLPSYYKTADRFLNTSHYEGYGRTIVEALACGCPVVSTDVGVAREAGALIFGNTRELIKLLTA